MRLDGNYRSIVPTTTTDGSPVANATTAVLHDAPPRNPNTVTPDDLSGNVLRGNKNMLGAAFIPLAGYEGARRATDPATPIVDKLAKLSPAKQLEYLHDLHAKEPAKFDALVKSIRDGNITDPKVCIPAAFELAASTPWGGSTEGKPVLEQVRKMYIDGKVKIGGVPDGALGFTHPAKESDGRVGGKGTTSEISFNPKLTAAPEALASVLAHEGFHAFQYAKGQMPNDDLQIELGASLVGARIWSEMGGDKEKVTGSGAREMVDQMKIEGAFYDPKKSATQNEQSMALYTAASYSYGFATAKNHSHFADGARIVNQLLARPDAAEILQNAPPKELRQLTAAYTAFAKANSGPFIRANLLKLIDVLTARNL